MKLKIWTMLAPIILACALTCANADTALDRYFALRRQTRANELQVAQAQAGPDSYIGRTIELRGTVSGIASGPESTSVIIDTGGGAFIVLTKEPFTISSGSRVCILARVGEKCTLSLTDLQLVAIAYQAEVTARERRALEADAVAKKAKESAAALRQRKAEMLARAKRAQNNVSRSAVYAPDTLIAIYGKAIKGFNKKLSESDADTIARSILGFSQKYQVDPRLVVAVILAESHFRLDATSRAGAMGLGQLMPGTAAGLGVSNAYNPVENIAGSVRLIKGHLDKLSGNAQWNDLTWHDLSLALASYNAGPGAVRKYGGVPPYKETRNYVNRVCSLYKRLCGQE